MPKSPVPTPDLESDTPKRRRAALAAGNVTERLRRRIIESGLPSGAPFASRRAIAEEFGVSLGTVQQAVSQLVGEGLLEARGNTGTVIGATGAQAPVKESYRITPSARGYIGIVGHVRPRYDGTDPHWQKVIISAIEREAADLGHPTLFYNLYRGPGENASSVDGFWQAITLGAEAVIGVMVDSHAESIQAACRAAWSSRPVVLAVSQPSRLPAIQCGYDATADGYRAAQHLIDAGCRRLLFVSPTAKAWAMERANGSKIAVEHNADLGISLDVRIDERNVSGPRDSVLEVARAVASEMMAPGIAYDGVIAANDRFAYGWIDVARSQGREPGRDYAIIGFDDLQESQEYGLTTMRPPIEGLGIHCARLAVAALRREEHPSSVTLRSHLVTRSSTRMLNGLADR